MPTVPTPATNETMVAFERPLSFQGGSTSRQVKRSDESDPRHLVSKGMRRPMAVAAVLLLGALGACGRSASSVSAE